MEVDTVRASRGPVVKNIAERLPAPVRCASQQFAVLKAKISRRRRVVKLSALCLHVGRENCVRAVRSGRLSQEDDERQRRLFLEG